MANKANDAKRQRAAAMLAAGETQSQICRSLNISRSTLWEWRKDPDFREAENAETLEFVRESRHLARSARDAAWSRLLKILRKSKNDAAAIRAASEILHTLGVLREPDKLVDASVKKFKVVFANLPGAKDE